MDTKILMLGGVGLAIITYLGIRFLRSSNQHNSKATLDFKIENVDNIDYEMLYDWLKNEYKTNKSIIPDNAKFGIMPPVLAVDALKKETNTPSVSTDIKNVICTFIIDEADSNIISRKYFIYNHMSESLQDILPENKVLIQNLKK